MRYKPEVYHNVFTKINENIFQQKCSSNFSETLQEIQLLLLRTLSLKTREIYFEYWYFYFMENPGGMVVCLRLFILPIKSEKTEERKLCSLKTYDIDEVWENRCQ